MEERKKGMKIVCSRCRKSETHVQWIDKKKWPWGAMTMVVQAVIHRTGWKTIDTNFVCPDCLTEKERQTDYSKNWYYEYYDMWKENKEQ
jgi:hypothetical protein